MDERTIQLNPDRQSFERYFDFSGEGNIYRNTDVRKQFLRTLIAGIVALIALLYATYTNQFIFISFLLTLLFMVLLTLMLVSICKLLKWKRGVNQWIDKVAQYKNQRLIISSGAFTLQQDEIETIETWSGIKSVSITPACISITGSHTYLFPRSSMEVEAFEYFSSIISDRMKYIHVTTNT